MSIDNNFNHIAFLWNIAESLRGTYKEEDYRKVMLPLIVIRRFDCLLDDYDREIVKSVYKEYDFLPEEEKDELVIVDLKENHNIDLQFYNVSDFTWKKLLDDSENIKSNFEEYLNGFSNSVKEIIGKFKFKDEISQLDKKDKLYAVLSKMYEVDLHINSVSNNEMGYIYEEMLRRFTENSAAGEQYTPREVIRLCMEMLFMGKENFLTEEGKVISIADFCCGTGGMLSIAEDYVEKVNPSAIVNVYGQELLDESFAICQADMIMKGQNPDNIRLGNTLTQDRFSGEKIRFLISNPPFGVTWKDEEKKVKEEADLGFDGRFGAGTPRVSDGSLLFLQNMISKMYDDEEGSRIAIIFNGSPLFTGDAGSGESNIRKWIIEKDLLEGIIALPTDMFYNTGIATYIWVLTNKKEDKRKGKIQLVNASEYYQLMRKSLGNKRKEISLEQIEEIKEIYERFEESENSKIFDNEGFGYRKVTIERPLKLSFRVNEEAIENVKNTTQFINLSVSKKKDEEVKVKEEAEGRVKQDKLLKLLESFDSEFEYMKRDKFIKDLKSKSKLYDVALSAGLIKAIVNAIGVRNEDAVVCKDAKGNIESDSSLKDTESIALKEDVYEYFEKEVKPHVEDAYIDESSIDNIGYEIPFTRYFYKYEKLKSFDDIMKEVESLEIEIALEIRKVLG
ncbi:class I SAM-dependent DNA methyltransferase [Clostridioides difficile]|uniref:type I restriction-modification system subunit M n=1 Tax=Clostridioides difficile TaxID=1496 RepID=UPI00038D3134|nr:class I SAM-dependent DNA methyltransferase [Clostridioides difficile]EGT4638265.1 SAM-dependent DNA methyltransferase [Clostridioides difficile]EQJ80943.1 N-6 DNA Methylase family protein [Clostridioides difficile P48]MBH8105753.1 SAM-dependent DNA methyltransferase [Clostridioides difficile]MCA0604464.1 type I restriction-modification system subunit M [Clostridioides difficile]MCO5923659.1 type I restriction-modification system subunit M [Clostridioides difficile]